MIHAPGLPENVTLIGELTSEIVTKILQPILELFLESVKNVVHVLHSLSGLLLVLLNLTAQRVTVSQSSLTAEEDLSETYV